MYLQRIIPIAQELQKSSILLLGPRRTGKSSFIRNQAPPHRVYDLLKSDVFLRLSSRPSLIRESLTADDHLIVIDEIQKLPSLMDEVQVMIEEQGVRFLLSGSSARKLRRTNSSLMAGRARMRLLTPFVSAEVPELALERMLIYGMLPPVVLSDEPQEELSSYTGLYLREEIQAEALSRNIEGFSRFLAQAALWSGELINFEGVGRDSQMPARTVREYYSLLEDTLLGTMVEPLQTTGKRKAISRGKFYFFDIGVVHALSGEWSFGENTPAFGKAFEHFIWQELNAYRNYFARGRTVHFWRDRSGMEVDFVLGSSVAVEVKCTSLVNEQDIKGLRAIMEQKDFPIERRIIVCREPDPRRLKDIEIIPYRLFLEQLWAGRVFP